MTDMVWRPLPRSRGRDLPAHLRVAIVLGSILGVLLTIAVVRAVPEFVSDVLGLRGDAASLLTAVVTVALAAALLTGINLAGRAARRRPPR